VVVVAVLPGNEPVLHMEDANPVNLEWANEPALPQQRRCMSFCEPVDRPLCLVKEALEWRILNGRHVSKTLHKPGSDFVTPFAWTPHARIKEFGILCVEFDNALYIVGVEGCNPAMH
jgi:hypothetical protein